MADITEVIKDKEHCNDIYYITITYRVAVFRYINLIHLWMKFYFSNEFLYQVHFDCVTFPNYTIQYYNPKPLTNIDFWRGIVMVLLHPNTTQSVHFNTTYSLYILYFIRHFPSPKCIRVVRELLTFVRVKTGSYLLWFLSC